MHFSSLPLGCALCRIHEKHKSLLRLLPHLFGNDGGDRPANQFASGFGLRFPYLSPLVRRANEQIANVARVPASRRSGLALAATDSPH
jgi:hypothetical protein